MPLAAVDTKQEADLMTRLSAYKEHLLERGIDANRAFVKRENIKAEKKSLQNTSVNPKGASFVIFKTTRAHLLDRKN